MHLNAELFVLVKWLLLQNQQTYLHGKQEFIWLSGSMLIRDPEKIGVLKFQCQFIQSC
jgi:hypothetical protein